MKKKISMQIVVLLLILFFCTWTYYFFINTRHIYNLIECSQGAYRIRFVPQPICRAYLFNFRVNHDDVALINRDGSLVGLLSASNENNTQLLEFLLGKGVSINSLDERAEISLLHTAVLDNNVEVVKLLLCHGANPLLRDKKRGLTAFEFALQLQNKPSRPDRAVIIKLLKDATNGTVAW